MFCLRTIIISSFRSSLPDHLKRTCPLLINLAVADLLGQQNSENWNQILKCPVGPEGRGRLQAKRWLNHHYQCDVTFRLDELQNGAQWVKYKRLIKMLNFVPIFCSIYLGSLICDLYYIEESLFGSFWWPKYSKGR